MQLLYDPASFLDSSCFSTVNSESLSDQFFASNSSAKYSMPTTRNTTRNATRNANNKQNLRSGSVLSALPNLISMDPAEQERLLRAATEPGHIPVPDYPDPPSMLPNETIFSNLRVQTGQVPGDVLASGQLVGALQSELKDNILDLSGSSLNELFPSSGPHCPVKIDTPLFQALAKENLWNTKFKRFVLPSDYKEVTIGKWLNELAIVMSKYSKKPLRRKWWDGCSTLPPSGTDYNCKPDLALLDINYMRTLKKKDTRIDWRFIRSIAEVTHEKHYPDRIIDTVTSKSFLMFACQHDRRFVPALTFVGDGRFRFTLTDREGQLRYECGNLKQSNVRTAKNLLLTLSYLMLGDISDVGLDPHFVCDKEGSVIAVNIDGKRFDLVQRIYTLKKLLGRGTKVWIVSNNGNRYILKDSWIQANRVESEIDHLSAMLDCKELKGFVPTLICGGDVYIRDRPDATNTYRDDDEGLGSARRFHRRIVTSPIGEPITSFKSKKEFILSLVDIITAHEILTNKLKILHHDISINNVLLCRNQEGQIATGMLIDFDYAETIKDTSESDLLQANVENPVVALPSQATNLEDLVVVPPGIDSITESSSGTEDLASKHITAILPDEQEQIWTGTPPFMAIEALINYRGQYKHQPRHDLESILYIILYACTYLNNPGSFRKTTDIPPLFTIPLGRWFKQEYVKEIGRSKIGHIETADVAILPKFTSYWDDFTPFVKQLIDECFPTRVREPNKLTHTNMKSILLQAVATVREPFDVDVELQRGSKRSHKDNSSRTSKKGKHSEESGLSGIAKGSSEISSG